MEMSHLASKLKALKLELSEDLLVHLVLISLPAQFSQFVVSYNCQKEKWTLNELISHCVQGEDRLKHERAESAHLIAFSKGINKKRKGKEIAVSDSKKKPQKVFKGHNKEMACFFCKDPSHVKKECAKYHAWRAKKGTPFAFVCSEVNKVSVPRHT